MINTKELMLGNLVECEGKYCIIETIARNHVVIILDGDAIYADHTDINPIELTDDVLKKLGMVSSPRKSVHELQNARKFIHDCPIDITPLLKPKPILTTHDGVEVFDKDAEVWTCWSKGYANDDTKKIKSTPMSWNVNWVISQNEPDAVIFSTLELCQSYIDQKWAELHPEPIFVTEDGVKVFEGDKYWYVNKNGSNFFDGNTIIGFICAKFSGKGDDILHFSSPELCQAYLNKVWAETEYQSLLKAKSEQ